MTRFPIEKTLDDSSDPGLILGLFGHLTPGPLLLTTLISRLSSLTAI
jgi:hypothetical protein